MTDDQDDLDEQKDVIFRVPKWKKQKLEKKADEQDMTRQEYLETLIEPKIDDVPIGPRARKQELENDLDRLKSERDELQGELYELNERRDEIRERLDELEAEMADVRDELDEVEDDIIDDPVEYVANKALEDGETISINDEDVERAARELDTSPAKLFKRVYESYAEIPDDKFEGMQRQRGTWDREFRADFEAVVELIADRVDEQGAAGNPDRVPVEHADEMVRIAVEQFGMDRKAIREQVGDKLGCEDPWAFEPTTE